mmetsp:Transcript_27941/g.71811  ORF Transcript_27941/g.71811 Transcript_27941/m.71811 type:complete len:89 (-) Transcript_27941:568-834(-)
MDGGRAANQPGRAQPAVQEQSPGLGPPEAAIDGQQPDMRPWPEAEQSYLDDNSGTSELQQHCNTLLAQRPQPSKQVCSSQPRVPARVT